jgi:hypothetical protein
LPDTLSPVNVNVEVEVVIVAAGEARGTIGVPEVPANVHERVLVFNVVVAPATSPDLPTYNVSFTIIEFEIDDCVVIVTGVDVAFAFEKTSLLKVHVPDTLVPNVWSVVTRCSNVPPVNVSTAAFPVTAPFTNTFTAPLIVPAVVVRLLLTVRSSWRLIILVEVLLLTTRL